MLLVLSQEKLCAKGLISRELIKTKDQRWLQVGNNGTWRQQKDNKHDRKWKIFGHWDGVPKQFLSCARFPNFKKGLSCSPPSRKQSAPMTPAHVAVRRHFWVELRPKSCNFERERESLKWVMLAQVWEWSLISHPVRRFLRWEATAIPIFVEGHASSWCEAHVKRAQIVVSAIWLTMLSKSSVYAGCKLM